MAITNGPQEVHSSRKQKSRRKHKEHIDRSRFARSRLRRRTSSSSIEIYQDFEILNSGEVINFTALS
ncbi:MAG: hypothetical protein WCN86_03130 [bacterium]